MKIVKTLIVILGIIGFSHQLQAQADMADRLRTEVLAYILPDSLEFKNNSDYSTGLEQVVIRSASLQEVLASVNVRSIAKAFPDWDENDSIAYTDKGERVEKPAFHRIFSLLFDSEQAADVAVEALQNVPGILFAEKNTMATLYNDPDYLNGNQWHLRNEGQNFGIAGADVNAESAWSIFTGSSDITIGIFDTGVESTHEDLQGKVSGDLPINNRHGTGVAGMAAAIANNGLGGRGLDWNANIRSYRIFDHANSQYIGDAQTALRITTAVDQGVQILNHSWGGTSNSTALAMAFAYAYRMNRVSVAAMGNDSKVLTNYPAAFSYAIAVGSTDNQDAISATSTQGNHIDVVAPGVGVFTTVLNNDYAIVFGTSFAAPLVSGLASLLKGYRNDLSSDDIQQIIRLSANNTLPGMNSQTFTTEYGYGRIDAGRALEMLRDNTLMQWTATDGYIHSSTGYQNRIFIGVPGLPDGMYQAKVYDVRKNVYFTGNFTELIGIWGRGNHTSGISFANPNPGIGFCQVVQGSITSSSATLRTCVYEIMTSTGNYLGFYPTTPANVTFAYTILECLRPS